jgi:glyoxylase-like metal-dependent hydrolase (beta-lactamase superfamily II)
MSSQTPKPLRHRASRRQLLQGAIGGMAGMALGAGVLRTPRAFAQTPAVTTTALASGLHVLSVGGSNVVAQTSSDGALLVDGGSAATADVIAAAVADLTRGPIRTLFNTHWHPEQTGLNARLGPAGARIIAQENTRLWLTTDITYPWDGSHFEPLPKDAQPSESFYDGEQTLDSGVRYGHLKHAAHTDGDLYVYFPDANVLAAGGAISGAGWPLVDWWTGGWIGGIVGTLELLLALTDGDTRVVPAEGRILTRADLEAQLEMYNTIYSRLARLLNGGMGPDEAIAAKPTEEFDAAMGPSDDFVRLAFQSLWAYLSPDA